MVKRMISRKKVVDYLRTFPEYSVDLNKPHAYIVQDDTVLGEILVDSTDFGAVVQIFDNREPYQIDSLLNHFTYEAIHTDCEYTQSKYSFMYSRIRDVRRCSAFMIARISSAHSRCFPFSFTTT